MVPQSEVSVQQEAAAAQEFLHPHAEAVFDWSQVRRDAVVAKSKGVLKDFLGEASDGENISRLWDNIVQCFTNHTEPSSATRLLRVGDKMVGIFQPSELPTHSEYHIAKVITLTTELFRKALPEDLQTRENALALTLSAVIHDIGSLQGVSESGHQEKFYRFHELRSIAMVDRIVDILHLEGYQEPAVREKLKQKIKLLIFSTVPKWNLDYRGEGATMIGAFVSQKGINMTEEDFIMGLELQKAADDDEETAAIKEKYTQTARDVHTLLKTQQDEKEMQALMKLMGAADHGAYLLEPARMGEIIGLWQELNHLWIDGQGKLSHREFPKDATNYLDYMTSRFPQFQWNTYGGILQTLGTNPFLPALSVAEMKRYIEATNTLLHQKSDSDALARLEGSLNPVEWVVLLSDSYDAKARDLLLKFSRDFAHKIHDAHDFDALSTPILTTLYSACGSRDGRIRFLTRVVQSFVKEESFELAPDGAFALHLAPFAYCNASGETLDQFMSNVSSAIEALTPDERSRIGSLTCTVRADQGDEVNSILTSFHNVSLPGMALPPLGISIGGKVKPEYDLQSACREAANANIPTLVHFGLEEQQEVFEKRMGQFLDLFPADSPEFSRLSIHVDDHFDWFIKFYDGNSQYQERLKKLIKSISPLGYVLTGGAGAIRDLRRFLSVFKDVSIGSHNSCLLGSFGLSGQRLIAQLLNDKR